MTKTTYQTWEFTAGALITLGVLVYIPPIKYLILPLGIIYLLISIKVKKDKLNKEGAD